MCQLGNLSFILPSQDLNFFIALAQVLALLLDVLLVVVQQLLVRVLDLIEADDLSREVLVLVLVLAQRQFEIFDLPFALPVLAHQVFYKVKRHQLPE